MSNDTRAAATLILVQEVVLRQLAHQKALTREGAGALFDQVGVRDIGLVDDEQIGSVQLTKGATRAGITDMEALIAWAVEEAPDQVVQTPILRATYLKALLDNAKRDGVAVTKDGEPIPGITVTQGDPSLMVKPSEDARDVIARAFADGRLTLGDLSAPAAIEAAS